MLCIIGPGAAFTNRKDVSALGYLGDFGTSSALVDSSCGEFFLVLGGALENSLCGWRPPWKFAKCCGTPLPQYQRMTMFYLQGCGSAPVHCTCNSLYSWCFGSYK